MFSLPKHYLKPGQNKPFKSNSSSKQTNTKKIPNINQIKQEIEFILKRNHSPSSLNVEKQINKSQRQLRYNLLQRKGSKILQLPYDQNIEKTKNNRKTHNQYFIEDIIPKSYGKTIQFLRQNLQTFTPKQASYGKQGDKDFYGSRSNFNQSKKIQQIKKQRNDQNMFQSNQIDHLGKGKLFFFKDSRLKIKRTNLLVGHTSTDRRNLFKDTAIQSFSREPSLNITRYLKNTEKLQLHDELKKKECQQSLQKQSSLEVLKKQIITKNSFFNHILSQYNPQQGKTSNTVGEIYQFPLKEAKRIAKLRLSPNPEPKLQQSSQTLNVMDQQLLVYYGKLKTKSLNNPLQQLKSHRTTILNRSNWKSSHHQHHSETKQFDNGIKTTMGIKNPQTRQNSWKVNKLDPWERLKLDDFLDRQDAFGNEESVLSVQKDKLQ